MRMFSFFSGHPSQTIWVSAVAEAVKSHMCRKVYLQMMTWIIKYIPTNNKIVICNARQVFEKAKHYSLSKYKPMSQPGNCTGYEIQGAWQGFWIME